MGIGHARGVGARGERTRRAHNRRLAEKLAVDLIVVGAHPRPEVVRLLVGSTAERVIRLAGRPVLAATGQRRASFRSILAAIDLSAHACFTLRVAAAIARLEDAFLRVLHVHEQLGG
ncbi:MAG: universal stress protein [Gemmatimonadales bacterium]|nr:universal stress protein [Gemmatimonadales bacterium]NIN48834.1 universal stress protein [Gemmatimonadales bacterium]NIP06298.1 universal stress protein [Gemmatimonadales bacterium]